MPRMTRAKAAEVAEQLHVDEDAVLETPLGEDIPTSLKTQTPERSPLEEIMQNSGESKDEDADLNGFKKSVRGSKGAKKGGQSRKVDLNGSTISLVEAQEQVDAVREAGATSTLDQTNKDLVLAQPAAIMADVAELSAVTTPMIEALNAESPAKDVRETDLAESHMQDTTEARDETVSVLYAPPSPLPSAVPNVIASLRKNTPGMRSTSNKENVEPMSSLAPSSITPRPSMSYDALEEAVVHGATPPGPSRRASAFDINASAVEAPATAATLDTLEHDIITTSKNELTQSLPTEQKQVSDPITAMDALDDAVERISAEVPVVQATPKKAKAQKATPIVRTTKASQARLSMAQAEKSGNPRPSSMIGRSNSVRQSVFSSQPTGRRLMPDTLNKSTSMRQSTATTQPAVKRVISGSSSLNKSTNEPREKKEVVIPHSKPRPMSVSFPTPPPPPKSRKAPTTSSFQLPGEAIAAKLKAAREERMKEAQPEEEKKPAFKARPVPAGLKKASSVRQTTASRVRESAVGGASTGGTHKRANSVMTSSTIRPLQAPTTKPALPALNVTKPRASTAMANLTQPRSSLRTSTIGTAPILGQRVPSGKGTSKGKEVFNRAALAKDTAVKEKREKEEAAKKARTAASERGRQASREWAEKQKMKKSGGSKSAGGDIQAAAGAEVVA
ncbi:hypothetical protein LTR78_006275 [Recurvomyces mirabilis]|uniref:Carboxylesterase family protein n=1 Tax=Recurvomyces mirabilis TaxID=574656 RepID=A0AAE0WL50_9PEZI|nr:hypothetical protein LTR78_006275 [Recurvomyces mirabilis]KAK5152164.1 hypothetical protein LTS14_008539 [Recurvomyces mirabilis]